MYTQLRVLLVYAMEGKLRQLIIAVDNCERTLTRPLAMHPQLRFLSLANAIVLETLEGYVLLQIDLFPTINERFI